MTQQQKLEVIVKKAIDGGWELDLPNWAVREEGYERGCVIGSLVKFEGDEWFSEDYPELHTNEVIYNHDFAKALFGEDGADRGQLKNYPKWMMHLQQAVVSDDPIGYMYEQIKAKENK